MRLKYDYSVISVIVDSLPGNTKNRESTRSWLIGVRLFMSISTHTQYIFTMHSWSILILPQHHPTTITCGIGIMHPKLSHTHTHTRYTSISQHWNIRFPNTGIFEIFEYVWPKNILGNPTTLIIARSQGYNRRVQSQMTVLGLHIQYGYGVATISGLLKIIGLFCKRAL